MLVAEGEIGAGRDVSQAVPGGFSSAGAINGNLRVRSAAVLLHGALGSRTPDTGPPIVDDFNPADDLPWFSIEKKVGTSGSELLVTRYTDAMVNTLNLTVPSGALATFSAGIISCGETKLGAPVVTPAYPATSDDLLLFHGGRIRHADTGTTLTTSHDDSTWQSIEVVINNNIQADEYTVRPSRFLRSLTEGIRTIELNLTLVFEDAAKYEKYTYGATGRTTPGYALYSGATELFLGNWQIDNADDIGTETPTGGPVSPQALQLNLPKTVFTGLPVALSTGRIAVSTTARALKPSVGDIITATVRPGAEGITT
jgi:hypothetical protein